MPFFRGLLGGRSADALPGTGGKEIVALQPSTDGSLGWAPGWTSAGSWDVAKATSQGYGLSVWVYAGLRLKANSQARRRLRLRDPSADADNPDAYTLDDPLLRLLNPGGPRPNPRERAHGFRSRLSKQLELSPRGAFVEVAWSRGRTPLGLDLLPPGRTKPALASDGTIDHFQVGPARWGDQPTEIPADRVLWVRGDEHPTDPLGGMTPLMAAGLSIELDTAAQTYNRNFLRNDARPGIVIGIKAPTGSQDADLPIDPADLADLDARVERGPLAAGKPMFVDGSLSVVDLSGGPRDGHYKVTSEMARDRILIAQGTPLSLLGKSSDSTFANASQDEVNFWFGAQAEHESIWLSTWDDLVPSGLVLELEEANVPALADLKAKRREEMRAEVEIGARSRLSYARSAGIGDVPDVAGTRTLWLPGGLLPVAGDEADQTAVDGLAAAMAPGVGGPAPAAVLPIPVAVPELPAGQGAKQLPADGGKAAEPAVDPAADAPEPDAPEPTAADVAAVALAATILALLAALGDSPDTVALAAGLDNLERVIWAAMLAQADAAYVAVADQPDLQPAAGAPATDTGTTPTVVAAIAVLTAAYLARPTVVPRLRGVPLPRSPRGGTRRGPGPTAASKEVDASPLAARAVLEATAAARAALRDRYRLAADERTGDPEWARLTGDLVVRQVLDTAAAAAAARAIELGVTVEGVWRTVGDTRVRASHRALNGRARTPGVSFLTGEVLRWPHDPLAPLAEVAGCRCSLTWRKAKTKTPAAAPAAAVRNVGELVGAGKALDVVAAVLLG